MEKHVQDFPSPCAVKPNGKFHRWEGKPCWVYSRGRHMAKAAKNGIPSTFGQTGGKPGGHVGSVVQQWNDCKGNFEDSGVFAMEKQRIAGLAGMTAWLRSPPSAQALRR